MKPLSRCFAWYLLCYLTAKYALKSPAIYLFIFLVLVLSIVNDLCSVEHEDWICYLFKRQIDRIRVREMNTETILHLLVYSPVIAVFPSGCKIWGQVRSQPGHWNSIYVAGVQVLVPFFSCLSSRIVSK